MIRHSLHLRLTLKSKARLADALVAHHTSSHDQASSHTGVSYFSIPKDEDCVHFHVSSWDLVMRMRLPTDPIVSMMSWIQWLLELLDDCHTFDYMFLCVLHNLWSSSRTSTRTRTDMTHKDIIREERENVLEIFLRVFIWGFS